MVDKRRTVTSLGVCQLLFLKLGEKDTALVSAKYGTCISDLGGRPYFKILWRVFQIIICPSFSQKLALLKYNLRTIKFTNFKCTIYWVLILIHSVAQSCLTLCDPMNRSTPGLPVQPTPGIHSLMSIESVMPSGHLILCHPLLLLPPIPPSIRVFQWVNSLHEVAKVLEFQLQHHSLQRNPRADLLVQS